MNSARTLVSRGDRIGIAFSGGKDSSVLLHMMKKLSGVVGFEIVAITVDEGIEGYRDSSIRIASTMAKELGIEHHVYSFSGHLGKRLDEIKTRKYCTYCGVFRRYILNKAARELGCNKIALGHNMDDEAQSILMNVIRNDEEKMDNLGTEHMSAAEGLVKRIRPLRNIAEREITAYATIKEIEFHEGECPHSFDNVRRDVQGFLNSMEDKSPGTKIQVVRFLDSARQRKSKIVNKCSECGEPTVHEICNACNLVRSI